jgi:hypothetical protein
MPYQIILTYRRRPRNVTEAILVLVGPVSNLLMSVWLEKSWSENLRNFERL